jgi:TP901 family phage tail tape measure protein
MAKGFVLTSTLAIQSPNMRNVVRNINNQLKGVTANVNVNLPRGTAGQLQTVSQNLQNVSNNAKAAGRSAQRMGSSFRGALSYLMKYDLARSIINAFVNTIRDGVTSAVAFEREMVKVSQVTGKTMNSLKGLEREITSLSTSLGVSSSSLVKTSRVLAQTGMSARDVKISLDALAKTTLAATFDDITSTTETAIAAMRQFNIEASNLERELGRINALAANFAVEAGDIGVAIRRAGGAFKAAGGQLMELEAMFTAVRSTTRETAETIATGFRTIFTRIQRPKTIQFLRQVGVELQDLAGNFVGPYEAVRRLNIALKDLDPRDVRYSQIVEQLGGFRQVSKVIPLIQQFGVAQKALNVAQSGGTSLARDAAKAQQSVAVQVVKVKEEFQALFRTFMGSSGMQAMVKMALELAKALATVAETLGPMIPMLTALTAAKGVAFLAGGMGRGKNQGGRINRFASGGMVPGRGNRDTVPAMLTPGEFVIRKSSVQAIGADRFTKDGTGILTAHQGAVQKERSQRKSPKSLL